MRYYLENNALAQNEDVDEEGGSNPFYLTLAVAEACRSAENKVFDAINQSIESIVIETGAKILIIDNLTYLNTENEKARNALPLMKHLNLQ